MAIEATWAKECGIEDIGAVGGGDNDDAFLGIKAVHFDEESVESLLTFVVSSTHSVTAVAADGVDFVDENQARGGFFALFEHIADATGADADEHFHEVGATDGEEGDIGFAGDGSSEEGFTGTWGADHEDAFGDATAEFLEAFGVAEEFDDLLDLFLGFFDAGDIFKSDFIFVAGEHFGFGLSEAHRSFASHANLLTEKEVENHHEEEEWHEDIEEGGGPEGAIGLGGDGDAEGFDLTG